MTSPFDSTNVGSPFNSPGMTREYGNLLYSSVTFTVSGVSAILPAPADKYLIWGFTLDVSSASALTLSFQNDLGVVFYKTITLNSGNGFFGSKNQTFNIPINAGSGRAVNLSIIGAGALSCIAGVHYTP